MILIDKINIKLNSQNIKHYINYGYECKPGDNILILVKHLSKGSNYKIPVRCDICENSKTLTYNKYVKNINNCGLYSCSNKCSIIKIKINFGVNNVFKLESVKEKSKKTKFIKYGDINFNNNEKYKKTCLEKYGVDNYSKSKEFSEKLGNSNDDWILYKRKCRGVYRKIRNEIIENWNGIDFYDNEFIKNNLKLKFYDRNYPTIDHRISVYEGFINNISIESINSIDNLVVTKRYLNSKKGYNNKNPIL